MAAEDYINWDYDFDLDEDGDRYQPIAVIVTKTTPKAVFVRLAGRRHWLPRSQILDGDEIKENLSDAQLLYVEEWILEKIGWDWELYQWIIEQPNEQ